ncbi:hypothetical protein ASG63_06005 [Methylobacterium sp. Leaf94]|uniref:hypothetical protein n=1 Tax=Methylobacterium sp. Leaf94 TaxID=1736250 RepID=UPI0006FE0ED0|nr:hypothetical protein [Methylobacterium sp. Leaf94]KQU21161.1 hypothetical protein ASG63_06005 [Methylobacterium sp. Leaf94]
MKAVMKTFAATFVVALGVAGATSVAMADYRVGPQQRPLPPTTWDGLVTGAITLPKDQGYSAYGCRRSSAQEGNANQQNFPVQQYGQVSGGYRC